MRTWNSRTSDNVFYGITDAHARRNRIQYNL